MGKKLHTPPSTASKKLEVDYVRSAAIKDAVPTKLSLPPTPLFQACAQRTLPNSVPCGRKLSVPLGTHDRDNIVVLEHVVICNSHLRPNLSCIQETSRQIRMNSSREFLCSCTVRDEIGVGKDSTFMIG